MHEEDPFVYLLSFVPLCENAFFSFRKGFFALRIKAHKDARRRSLCLPSFLCVIARECIFFPLRKSFFALSIKAHKDARRRKLLYLKYCATALTQRKYVII